MRSLHPACSAELAVSWPRAMEGEKLSNFKTALGQFNKLLPPHPLHIFEFSKIHSHLRCIQDWKDFGMLIMQNFTA